MPYCIYRGTAYYFEQWVDKKYDIHKTVGLVRVYNLQIFDLFIGDGGWVKGLWNICDIILSAVRRSHDELSRSRREQIKFRNPFYAKTSWKYGNVKRALFLDNIRTRSIRVVRL